MMTTAATRYRAHAAVSFPRIDAYLEPILESIATHDMTVTKANGLYHILSPFGNGTFEATDKGFNLTVQSCDPGGLNRLKHALVGPIGFIAAREALEITWEGDYSEPALPDDLRILHVASIEEIAPRFRRIRFTGDNLDRYDRPDQLHCRLIFQARHQTRPIWPMLDHRGQVVWPDGIAVPTRVYTIRQIDATKGEIVIDFALHANAGPATRWAHAAQRGDEVGILGPAANGPKPARFLVLAGDETALPGIARILKTLPDDSEGKVFLEIDARIDELPLHCPPKMDVHWLHRDGKAAGTTPLLINAVRSVRWPEDLENCFFWGGCEHAAFNQIHRHLRQEIKLPRDRTVFYSYWHRSLSEEDIIARGAEAYLPS